MKIDKRFFYISIEAFYTEEQIQKMFNIVENIEELNMPAKEVYDSLKLYKPRDVNVILGMAFFENKMEAQMKIFLAEKAIIRDTLLGFRDALRNETMDEFFKDYYPEDYFYLENLIIEDDLYLNENQKDLYINEVKYLNGEIELAIPKIKVRKKRNSNIEDR